MYTCAVKQGRSAGGSESVAQSTCAVDSPRQPGPSGISSRSEWLRIMQFPRTLLLGGFELPVSTRNAILQGVSRISQGEDHLTD
jgi:hypothetical protein